MYGVLWNWFGLISASAAGTIIYPVGGIGECEMYDDKIGKVFFFPMRPSYEHQKYVQ